MESLIAEGPPSQNLPAMVQKNSRTRRSFLERGLLAVGASSGGMLLGDAAGDFAAPDRSRGGRESSGVLYEAKPGPWGALSYYYFYLEAPSHLADFVPLPNPRTRWAVPTSQESALLDVIHEAPLSESQRSVLLNPDHVGIGDEVYAIFPPADLLEAISPEARAFLYRFLARFEYNSSIRDPVRIRSGSVDEWAQGTDIRPDLVERMRRMTYLDGDLLLFADFPHLIGLAHSEEEAKMLHKRASRVRSMVVRLDVKKSPPVEEIMPYWQTGLGLRRKEVELLLRKARETPGVDCIDIVHLLPALPRKLLYSYPDMSMAIDGVLPDCHWTALNFFNYNPQPTYLDKFFAASGLLEGFGQVEPPYRFGDVVVFLDEDMNAYHSCVYLAADIVFTKNGRSLYAPWTLLPLGDVASTYREGDGRPLHVQGYRKTGD